MKIMDISVAFQEGMMKYPSLLPFERKWLRSFENGDQNQVSYIQSPSHNGTHLDAPSHYRVARPWMIFRLTDSMEPVR